MSGVSCRLRTTIDDRLSPRIPPIPFLSGNLPDRPAIPDEDPRTWTSLRFIGVVVLACGNGEEPGTDRLHPLSPAPLADADRKKCVIGLIALRFTPDRAFEALTEERLRLVPDLLADATADCMLCEWKAEFVHLVEAGHPESTPILADAAATIALFAHHPSFLARTPPPLTASITAASASSRVSNHHRWRPGSFSSTTHPG